MPNPSGADAPPPAVEAVLEALHSWIELGVLLPGEQFRQEDLATSLGVSRAPVREALRVLEHDGVAEHHPNRGYFVARRPADEQRQLFRMLELLEGELIARLAWPDPDALDDLAEVNERLRAVSDLSDPAPAITLNREFHRSLFALSPDALVRSEVLRLWSLAAPTVAASLADPNERVRLASGHDAVLEALRSRRRLGLLHAMEAHRAREARGLDPGLVLGSSPASAPSLR